MSRCYASEQNQEGEDQAHTRSYTASVKEGYVSSLSHVQGRQVAGSSVMLEAATAHASRDRCGHESLWRSGLIVSSVASQAGSPNPLSVRCQVGDFRA